MKKSYFNKKSITSDIDLIFKSMKLYSLPRFFKHRFWEKETLEAEYAIRIEPFPRLETVAEHSWHVADIVLLLGPRFPSLKLDRCLRIAILHDKMEMYTGDQSPTGKGKRGSINLSHAFNEDKRLTKEQKEIDAMHVYFKQLSDLARLEQERDLYEILEGSTQEALFVKAVDKMQALAYVILKKRGLLEDKHIDFTLQYSQKAIDYYPGLETHYKELRLRLLNQIARQRKCSLKDIRAKFETEQCALKYDYKETQEISLANSTLPNIALYGHTGSGKSRIAEYLALKYGYGLCSSGTICRKICGLLFQSESKELLNRITDVMKSIDENIWLHAALSQLPQKQPFVFDSMRFKNDYDYFQNLGFCLLRVVSPLKLRIERLQQRGQEFDPKKNGIHSAEIELEEYIFDYIITNDSDIHTLFERVDKVMLAIAQNKWEKKSDQ